MEGAAVKVDATFEFIGGVSPAALNLTFSVNGEGKITRVEQVYIPKQAQSTDTIPAGAKVLINNARTNGNADSPHLIARSARGEIYFGHAEKDKYAAANVAQTVSAAFKGCAVRVQSVVHKQAQHAYAIPDRDVFDKHAANRDWEHIFAMLRRQIPRLLG